MKMQNGVLIKTLASTFIALMLSVTSVMSYAKEVNVDAVKQMKHVVQQQTVNINQSNVSKLITLKGIGESKAQAIVDYRQKFGSFKSVSELSEVSGVGPKIIDDNKSRLTI